MDLGIELQTLVGVFNSYSDLKILVEFIPLFCINNKNKLMEKTYTLEEISKLFVGENEQGGYFDQYLDYCILNGLKGSDAPTFKEWFEQNIKED